MKAFFSANRWERTFLTGMVFVLLVGLSGCATTTDSYSIDENYRLGRQLYQGGQYEKAKDYFLQYNADNPDSKLNEVVFYYLGRCFYELEDYAQARSFFQRLVTEYPEGFWADLAREEMEKIDSLPPA